jgi:hypothetical protein
MPTKTDKFLDEIADNNAETDEIAEQNVEQHNIDFNLYLNDVGARDPELWFLAWQNLLQPVGIPFEDWFGMTNQEIWELEQTPLRDLMWQATVAAARAQADTETIRQMIVVADKHAKKLSGIKLSRGELETAAQEGVGSTRFKAAKERRINGKAKEDNDGSAG